MFPILGFSSFKKWSRMVTFSGIKLNYLCSCKLEISNVSNVKVIVFSQAMKIVHHYANRCFDWLISGLESVNPWGEPIFLYCLGNTKDLRLSIMWFRQGNDEHCICIQNAFLKESIYQNSVELSLKDHSVYSIL